MPFDEKLKIIDNLLKVVWMEVPYCNHRVVCDTDNTNGITVGIVELCLVTTQGLDAPTAEKKLKMEKY